MKNNSFYALAGLLFLGLTAPDFSKKEVHLACTVVNCEKVDSLFMFEFNGIGFSKIQSAPIVSDKATFSLPIGSPRFLYVGLTDNNLRPLILGSEENVALNSDCNGFRSAQITVSQLNEDYEETKKTMNALNAEMNSLARQYQTSLQDPAAIDKLTGEMAALDKRKLEFLEETKKKSNYLASIVALNTYLSFQNNRGTYVDEVEYFANEYFKFVDWKSEYLTYQAWVYEATKTYATALGSVGLPDATLKTYLDNMLSKVPKNSRTYQLALGGVMTALKQKNNGNFPTYAKAFVEAVKPTDPSLAAAIEKELKMASAFMIGGEAPDFTQNQPDGTPFSLSNLRGKVVLVDFWASWCGPCRRENPNVVKLYNRYKSQGFDILGVSLDKTQDRWVQAIEEDGLIWHHISDLKGWANEVAKMYGVSSIPHTILLDKEGRILARNLRGPQLEEKLREIFGE